MELPGRGMDLFFWHWNREEPWGYARAWASISGSAAGISGVGSRGTGLSRGTRTRHRAGILFFRCFSGGGFMRCRSRGCQYRIIKDNGSPISL